MCSEGGTGEDRSDVTPLNFRTRLQIQEYLGRLFEKKSVKFSEKNCSLPQIKSVPPSLFIWRLFLTELVESSGKYFQYYLIRIFTELQFKFNPEQSQCVRKNETPQVNDDGVEDTTSPFKSSRSAHCSQDHWTKNCYREW